MNFLETEDVVKQYANHLALDKVSIQVPEGKVFGLLGPNGAGKTTLIRIINRITAPDSGLVRFNGREFQPEDIYQIGYLPEERGLYKKMKVGEQAIYLAQLKGLSYQEARIRLIRWFEKFDIMPWWNKKLEELSKGMQQKIQFIITIIHEPKLLIFDEPFSGFDPVNAELLKKEILELKDAGHTIIFSTHNMSSVEELPLCREGADQLYEKIEKYDYPSVQKVYTSPLKRCKQTISILQPNRLVAEMPELREMDFGKFENKTADELMNDPDYEQFIKGGLDNPPPNGESTREVINRCYEALNIIISDMMYEGLTNVAVCTHGGLIMNMLAGFGVPKRKPMDYACDFGEGFEVMVTASMWQRSNAFEVIGTYPPKYEEMPDYTVEDYYTD